MTARRDSSNSSKFAHETVARCSFPSATGRRGGVKEIRKNIPPRNKVLTSSSKWSETPAKHIRENGSLKSETARPDEEAPQRDWGGRTARDTGWVDESQEL